MAKKKKREATAEPVRLKAEVSSPSPQNPPENEERKRFALTAKPAAPPKPTAPAELPKTKIPVELELKVTPYTESSPESVPAASSPGKESSSSPEQVTCPECGTLVALPPGEESAFCPECGAKLR